MALTIPTRDALIQQYKTNYVVRAPNAKTGTGTLVDIDARQGADVAGPLYAEGSRLGGIPSLTGLTRAQLIELATDLGLPGELAATGASGFVQIVTATGGANILTNAPLQNSVTQIPYACAIGRVYGASPTDNQVPVYATTTGPATDVVPGTVLQWSSPALGLQPTCTVVADADGNGLTGGADIETDDSIAARIRTAYADPAMAGNGAAYRALAARCPGVSVEAAFTFPCIEGPGTICLLFTVRPSVPGGSRVPNGEQIGAMAAWLIGQFPEDDSLFAGTIVEEPTAIITRVRFQAEADGWVDSTPWPPYNADHFTIAASPSPAALSFTVETTMGSPPNPQPGQTIALWNAAANSGQGAHVPKRILSVSGSSSPWTITVDATLNASDTTFAPAAGDLVGPWSDSLTTLAPVMVAEFNNIGPGEQVASFYDFGGMRQRRQPAGTVLPFSYEFTGRVLTPLFALAVVDALQIVEPALPAAPSTGTLAVSSNMLTLQAPIFYPL